MREPLPLYVGVTWGLHESIDAPRLSAFLKPAAWWFDNEDMNRTSISQAAGVLVLGSLITACGATATPEVVLEAHWQCDVQRVSFVDISELNAELESRIASAGMTVEEYNDFKVELSESEDLRSSVASEYEEYCQE